MNNEEVIQQLHAANSDLTAANTKLRATIWTHEREKRHNGQLMVGVAMLTAGFLTLVAILVFGDSEERTKTIMCAEEEEIEEVVEDEDPCFENLDYRSGKCSHPKHRLSVIHYPDGEDSNIRWACRCPRSYERKIIVKTPPKKEKPPEATLSVMPD